MSHKSTVTIPASLIDVSASGPACELPGGNLMWEYECHNCSVKFKTQVPCGPREEREIRCPDCGSANIERLNVGALAPTACGG